MMAGMISAERFLALHLNTRYSSVVTRARSVKIILVLWVISVCLGAIIPLISVYVFSTVLLSIVSSLLLAMIASYWKCYHTLRNLKRRARARERADFVKRLEDAGKQQPGAPVQFNSSTYLELPSNRLTPSNLTHGNQETPSNIEVHSNQSATSYLTLPNNQVTHGNLDLPNNQVTPRDQVEPSNQVKRSNQVMASNQVMPRHLVTPGNTEAAGGQDQEIDGQDDQTSSSSAGRANLGYVYTHSDIKINWAKIHPWKTGSYKVHYHSRPQNSQFSEEKVENVIIIKNQPKCDDQWGKSGQAPPDTMNYTRTPKINLYKYEKVSRTMVLLIALLFASYTTYLVVMPTVYFIFGYNEVFKFCSDVGMTVVYINSTINPLIYLVRMRQVRHCCLAFFRRCLLRPVR
ncbi:uncharacterized protein LOC5503244 [Nematostella vectensis]|nr:uncharacterized protein LOC5503244 [Nematostella vectensis]